MQAISVINFKGGVGKTTLTVNLGVELARRGLRTLLIDLDPQSSLTFSFFTPDDYDRRLRGTSTIKCWLDGFQNGQPTTDLSQFCVPAAKINQIVGERGGYVHVLPSDLSLAAIELDMVRFRGPRAIDPEFEIAYRRSALFSQLHRYPLAGYDFVLMDCPPSLGILTQSAIVACSRVLVPTKADYISHVGIAALVKSMEDLRVDYNGKRAQFGLLDQLPKCDAGLLGVVFNMVSLNPQGRPVADHQYYIDRVKSRVASSFTTMIRDSDKHFGRVTPTQGPAILNAKVTDHVYVELMGLATEFLSYFPEHSARSAVA
jgi:chromosome partitioning protein